MVHMVQQQNSIDAFDEACDAYLNNNWNTIVSDLRALVQIPSFDQSEQACEGAPFGPAPRAALDKALSIAARMGFEVHNCEGYIGYADWHGESGIQLGLICHVDVVPAGPGWDFDPFDLTEHDGYLIGRGVSDDKGPLIISLHALNFWKQQGANFPYTVRFLFGSNEEVGMDDVRYYRSRFNDPAFLFTPDAEFPVCHGEKGIYQAVAVKKLPTLGSIDSICAGEAINAVPGEAFATIGGKTICEKGISAHAAMPHLGNNAIAKLARTLLKTCELTDDERNLLTLSENLSSCTDGSLFGLSCSDESFGALTLCSGMLHYRDGIYTQSIDIRYPTTIDADAITHALADFLGKYGLKLRLEQVKEPFLIDAHTPAITALRKAYAQVTDTNPELFTMGGGTYAREFNNAASFGMEPANWTPPAWVGGMHGPNEGIYIENYKQAFKIYAHAIFELMNCNLR